MVENRLPIQIPTIKSYKHHALPFAIIYEHNQQIKNWINTQYIQLHAKSFVNNSHWLDFFVFDAVMFRSYAPWITIQNINIELINSLTSFSHLVRTCIDRNKYVYINYDSYYISYTFAFEKNHEQNNMLITGYNDTEECYEVLDYSYNTSRQLEIMKLPMREVEKAFNSGSGWARILELNSSFSYEIDYELVLRLLEDYLFSRDSSQAYCLNVSAAPKDYFGMNTYQALKEYCNNFEHCETRLSLLPFSILIDHKKNLLELIDQLYSVFLTENLKNIQTRYADVVNLSMINRNLVLKFNVRSNIQTLDSIKNNIDKIKFLEYEIINLLIEELKERIMNVTS